MSQILTADPDALAISFVPRVDDQVQATRAAIPARPARRWWFIALLLILTVNVVMQIRREGLAALFGFAGYTVLAMVVGSAAFLGAPLVLRRALLRHGRKHPEAYSAVTYTFGADGLRVESKISATELPWSSVTHARETAGLFLLHVAGGRVFFVPRRALRDRGEARLRTLLGARLGPRAELMQPTNGR